MCGCVHVRDLRIHITTVPWNAFNYASFLPIKTSSKSSSIVAVWTAKNALLPESNRSNNRIHLDGSNELYCTNHQCQQGWLLLQILLDAPLQNLWSRTPDPQRTQLTITILISLELDVHFRKEFGTSVRKVCHTNHIIDLDPTVIRRIVLRQFLPGNNPQPFVRAFVWCNWIYDTWSRADEHKDNNTAWSWKYTENFA